MASIPIIAPMLVSTGPIPRDAVWELKWDGFRACVVLDAEGGILKKAAAWFAKETGSTP
jgi:ATP-dependent DNA ligase